MDEKYNVPNAVNDEPADSDWWKYIAELHKKLFVDDRPVEEIAKQYREEVREMACKR